MAESTHAVGDPVQSRCTKCRRITRHVIVSLMETKPARVECTACEGVHNYRPPKATKAKTAGAASRRPTKASVRASAKADALAQEFETAVSKLDPKSATPYTMTTRFRSRSLLDHPTFGLGFVQRVIPPNKIEVLFRDALRRLRCSG